MNRTAKALGDTLIVEAAIKRCLDITAKLPEDNSMAVYVVSQNPKLSIDEAKEILHCMGG